MVHLNFLTAFEIGYRPRHFKDAVVSTTAEVELRNRRFEQIFRFAVHLAELLNRLRPHPGVAAYPRPLHAAELLLARLHDAPPYSSGRFARALAHQLFRRETRHLDVDVDAVEEGTTYLRQVASDLGRGAGADGALAVRAGFHSPWQVTPIYRSTLVFGYR